MFTLLKNWENIFIKLFYYYVHNSYRWFVCFINIRLEYQFYVSPCVYKGKRLFFILKLVGTYWTIVNKIEISYIVQIKCTNYYKLITEPNTSR